MVLYNCKISFFIAYLLLFDKYIKLYSIKNHTKSNHRVNRDISLYNKHEQVPLRKDRLTLSEYSFWFTSKPDCLNITTNESEVASKLLYHLPTHEGLASQFHQLEFLWNLVNKINLHKTIVRAPFSSHHYRDVSYVSDCDIFKYPVGITCSCSPMHVITKTYPTCIILGFSTSWSAKPKDYQLNPTIAKVQHIVDLKSTNCIAGQTYNLRYKHEYYLPQIHAFPVKFQDKYEIMANKLISIMSINRTFLTAHWRRGDQSCADTTNLHGKQVNNRFIALDKSLNCGTAYDLVNGVHSAVKRHRTEFKFKPIIYVTTNENNQTVLDILHRKEYLTSQFMRHYLKPYGIKLNSLDIFVIEMIFMCKSMYYFHWGRSGIHDLIDRCKNAK